MKHNVYMRLSQGGWALLAIGLSESESWKLIQRMQCKYGIVCVNRIIK